MEQWLIISSFILICSKHIHNQPEQKTLHLSVNNLDLTGISIARNHIHDEPAKNLVETVLFSRDYRTKTATNVVELFSK